MDTAHKRNNNVGIAHHQSGQYTPNPPPPEQPQHTLTHPIPRNQTLPPLYLAVPLERHHNFFQLDFTQKAIAAYQIQLIVYDPVKESISQWIN
ncbi:element excision factor XisH family protein [Spirulina major CS-329]|uniref:element excision factor XisH family protein n=1 Tax=Spirulina TaxID=1154 RepID=UPI00232DFC09|nr:MULTISPECIES: element excision factor XisH family protein [Spirulina]MDB9494657.1 element excision factor XisH family protein [Spirulina subsalsa CS-330]MDB9503684.1 element excision factor XisH family protein [Spirulina major CS-329]